MQSSLLALHNALHAIWKHVSSIDAILLSLWGTVSRFTSNLKLCRTSKPYIAKEDDVHIIQNAFNGTIRNETIRRFSRNYQWMVLVVSLSIGRYSIGLENLSR